MKYSPTQNNPRVTWIFAALLIFGGITYAVPIVCEANEIAITPLPFTALTLISVVAAVFIMIRYRMTSVHLYNQAEGRHSRRRGRGT